MFLSPLSKILLIFAKYHCFFKNFTIFTRQDFKLKKTTTMTLQDLKNDLRNWVAADKLEIALEQLIKCLSEPEHLNMAIMLKSRHTTFRKSSISGVTEINELNLIKNDTLKLIGELREADIRPPQSALQEAVATLGIGTLGKAFLVNCNRTEQRQTFKRHFRTHQKQPFQFYFIVGCPKQAPDDFTENLIYEIVDRFAAGDTDAVDMVTDKKSVYSEKVERAVMQKLPIGGDCANSIALFKKDYFSPRLLKFGLQDISIEDFVKLKKTQLPFKYMIFTLELNANTWREEGEEMTEYVKWIIQQFHVNGGENPSFLFFFVVNMPNAHTKEDAVVMSAIEHIHQTFEESCRLTIKDMSPVALDHIESWFESDVNPDNPVHIPAVMAVAKNDWTAKNWAGGADINMMFLKDMQAAVYVESLKSLK
jgi:hypothetical protein